jgi:hypothetical protein
VRILTVLLLGAAVALAAPAARADQKDVAEALFAEARALMSVGKYAEACPKLEQSNKADPAVGTLLNLASCYEHVGKTASAWAIYNKVASTLGARPARAQFARARAAALAPTLARLTVRAPSVRVVTRDGASVPPASFGVAVPVDPGPHVVEAISPGRARFRRVVVIPAGATVVVVVPR